MSTTLYRIVFMVISHCTGQVLTNMRAHIFPFDSGLRHLLRANAVVTCLTTALLRPGTLVDIGGNRVEGHPEAAQALVCISCVTAFA